MSIVSCPKCQDRVGLPEGASPRATVRCPLCQEAFLLSEILERMPPTLVVVEDPDAPASATAPASPGAAGALDEAVAEELAPAGAEPIAAAPAFSIQPTVAPAAPTAAAPRRRRAAARARGPKSPAKEVVKIVLGGMAGLAIGQLILWWLPWANWRKDPIGLGPKISQFAPWIVPEQFHSKRTSNSHRDGQAKPAAKSRARGGPSRVRPPVDGGLPKLDHFVDPSTNRSPGQPKGAGSPPSKAKRAPGGAKRPTDASLPSGTVLEQARRKSADGLDTATGPPHRQPKGSEGAAAAIGDLDDLEIELDPITMLEPKPQPRSGGERAQASKDTDASKTAGRVSIRLAKAHRMSASQWERLADDGKAALEKWKAGANAESYRTFMRLAEAVALAEDVHSRAMAVAKELVDRLSRDDAQLETLARAGVRWLDSGRRNNQGVLLVGTVKRADPRGDLCEIHLQIAGGESPLSALAYDHGRHTETYQVGSKVLVLGAVIDDPATDLVGYTGDAERVIWIGLSRSCAGG